MILDEAIEFINEREKPLAAYCFTTDKKEAGLTIFMPILPFLCGMKLCQIQYAHSVGSIYYGICDVSVYQTCENLAQGI